MAQTNRTWIFIAALASAFMTAVEATIVATAMPTIVGALGGFELLSWVFTAYLLAQTVTIPIYGRLADLYGRKPILLVGIAIFVLGSVLCGFAWGMPSLIACRALQGLGAGAVMPVSRTLIGDVYRGAERARMQGYVSSVFVSSAVLGPMLGAFLAAHTIWSMVFWINVPVGLAAAVLLLWKLDEVVERRPHRIDYTGSALLAAGSGLLMFVLAEATRLSLGMGSALTAAATMLLALFAFWEGQVREPIWPPALLRDRIVASGNIVSLALGAMTMGFAAFLPAYIQGVMGRTALVAGAIVTAMSATAPVGAVLGGRIMLRSSFRAAATAGAVISIAGSLLLLRVAPDGGLLLLLIGGPLLGFGMGMNNNTYMVAIQSIGGWNVRGAGTATIIFTRILGQAMGAALFGGIVNALLAHEAGGADMATRMLDPGLRHALPAAEFQALIGAFDQAVHIIFLTILGFALLVLVIGFLLPDGVGLRQEAGADD
ncbi:MAG TPA: MFS transporter [Stellaceae bacterium]|nr:MFS transporter [Stellaceae bacterium]